MFHCDIGRKDTKLKYKNITIRFVVFKHFYML